MSKGGFENFYPIIEEKQLKVRRESNDEIKKSPCMLDTIIGTPRNHYE